jgi:ABC-type transport system involved in multi-copper enzyme maturation permease subunit
VNRTIARQMIAAEVLKLRRHRPTMMTGALLCVGIALLYFSFIEARHHGNLAGPQALSDGATLMGIYFGGFAAILIGAEAGTIDLTSGTFRDLVATGRSRTVLFLVRVPAAILIAVPLTLAGYAVAVAAAYAFHGSATAPTASLAVEFAAWVALATVAQATLAVGVASLTGSRSVTLVAVIGWNTVATGILYLATFVGPLRDLVLLIALGDLFPGQQAGTHAHPGSSIALNNFKLPMPAVTAVVVILAWVVIAAVAGAWRTRNRDA